MIVSRFAPSPTGRLHLGHAYSAVLGHARARESGGQFLLRIEDLDQTRSRSQFVAAIEEDLRWLGLDWNGEPIVQSERTAAYDAALRNLHEQRLVYACFCTRSDIAAAMSAPHGSPGAHYPGTCRSLTDDPQRRAARPHCWRLDVKRSLAVSGLPEWRDYGGQRFTASPDELDDIIIARKDAPASYHLACIVDDAETGVTLVVRGEDLQSSTPIQRLLQMLLELPEPNYLHHPLVMHSDGRRLAKRDRAPTLAGLRDDGVDGRMLASRLLEGLLPSGFRLAHA